jgi:electron transport complex protein RnfG
MKKYLQLTLVLFVIAAFSGLIIGSVNIMTRDTIAKNNQIRTEKGIKKIFVDSAGFTDLAKKEGSTFKANTVILELYEVLDENKAITGYVFKVNAPGSYSGTLVALIGFDLEGTVKGISYVNVLETVNVGSDAKLGKQVTDQRFIDQFVGKEDVEGVDTISGASKSSNAVIRAVETVQKYFNENIKE